MIETVTEDELPVLIVTMWGIWSARRKVVLEGIYQTPMSRMVSS